MELNAFSFAMTYPATETPLWADLVERWYQMDAPSLALTSTYWKHRESLPEPAMIFFASPGASNFTDRSFAENPTSPAKFVHTLPNIRSAALLQVMKWSGPVFCLQNDPDTILSGLKEAWEMAEALAKPVWVASVSQAAQEFTGHIYVLGASGPLQIRANPGLSTGQDHDKHWLLWLNGSEHERAKAPFIGGGLEISQSPSR